MGNTHSLSCIIDGCGKYEPEFVGEIEAFGGEDRLEVVESQDQAKPSTLTNSSPSGMLNNSDEKNENVEKWIQSPNGLFLKVDQHETESIIVGDSPRSIESVESVMTAISPTKDKAIKKRRQRIVSPIQTKFNHSLEVSIGQRGSGSQSIEQSVLDETYFCIVNGNIERLSELVVDNKLDLAQVQFQGLDYSPLHVAVIHDQLAMVQYLLDKNVDINLRDKDGQTATYLAYTLGRHDITNLLVAIKSAEFSSSPFSPYGNSTGAASRVGSTDSYDSRAHYDLVPTSATTHTRPRRGSDDVIKVARDNSFRSAHSIDFPVQHPHKSNRSRRSSSGPSGKFSHSRHGLSKVPFFSGTVDGPSDVFGTIHTTCSFDDDEFDALNRGQSFKSHSGGSMLPEGGESSRTPFQSPVKKWVLSEWPASRPHFATSGSRPGLPPIHGAGYFAPSPEDSPQHDQQHRGTDFIGGPPGSTGAIYIDDHAGTDGSSLTNTNDFSSDGGASASVLIHGVAGVGAKKPLRKRLRKAAGKVLSFMVPHHRGSDNSSSVSGNNSGYSQM